MKENELERFNSICKKIPAGEHDNIAEELEARIFTMLNDISELNEFLSKQENTFNKNKISLIKNGKEIIQKFLKRIVKEEADIDTVVEIARDTLIKKEVQNLKGNFKKSKKYNPSQENNIISTEFEMFLNAKEKNEWIDTNFQFFETSDFINMLKHKQKLTEYLEGGLNKNAKNRYEKFKKMQPENTEESIIEMLEYLDIAHKITKRPIGEIAQDFKEIAEFSLCLEYVDIAYRSWLDFDKMEQEYRKEETRREEEKKQEAEKKDFLNKIQEAKKQEEERIKLQNKKELEELNKPVAANEGECIEFKEYIEKIQNQITVKESVFPIFLHIYSKEEGSILDFASEKQMQEWIIKQEEK